MLQVSLLIKTKCLCSVDGTLFYNSTTFLFMTLKMKLGLTLRLLIKSPNGIWMVVWLLPFLHGNISYLVGAVETFSREATEPAASMLVILGILILIMKNGFQSNWKKIKILYLSQENHLPLSIILMTKDFMFSAVGQMIGWTICGSCQ